MKASRFQRAAIGTAMMLGAGGLAACSSGGSAGDDENFDLNISVVIPESAPAAESWKALAAKLEEDSDGRIKANLYWAGSLVSWPESLSGVGSGLADIAVAAPIIYPSEMPLWQWVTPLTDAVETPSPTVETAAKTAALASIIEDEAFQAELDNANVTYLSGFSHQSYSLFCTDDVASSADAKGLKVRSPGGYLNEPFNAMGMTAVSIPINEAYEGLQRGVIDCDIETPASLVDFGVQEVVSHAVWATFAPGTNLLLMNKDKFDRMPEDLQQVVRDAAVQFSIDQVVTGYERIQTEFSEGGKAAGLESRTVPELAEALVAQRADTLAGLSDGLDDVISSDDAARLLETYRSTVTDSITTLGESGFDTSQVDDDVLGRYLRDSRPEALDQMRSALESLLPGASAQQ